MNHKQKWFFIIAFLCGCNTIGSNKIDLTSSVHRLPSVYTIEKEFKAFRNEVTASDKIEPDQMLESFKRHILTNHYDLYDIAIVSKRKPNETLEQKIKTRLPDTVKFISDSKSYNKMMSMFENFNTIVTEQIKIFRKSFPKFTVDDLPIVGAISLLGMNAGGRPIDGKLGLVFGIDSIIHRDDNLPLLFSHELFHIYHQQASPKMRQDSKNYPFTLMTFMEGLATFVSGELNPDMRSLKYFDNDLMKWCESSKYRKAIENFQKDMNAANAIAQKYHGLMELMEATSDPKQKNDYQRQADSTYSHWIDLERKWFLTEGKPGDIPLRAAYCIGERAIDYLSKNSSYKLDDFAKWDFSTIHAKMANTLSQLANEGH